MSQRITKHVTRQVPVEIFVNGTAVTAYEGESLATALIAAGTLVFSRDASGRARSPFCNMGVCFDCLVEIEQPSVSNAAAIRRVRACMTAVRAGMFVVVPEQ